MDRSGIATIAEATGRLTVSLIEVQAGKTRDEFTSEVSNVLANVFTNGKCKVINALADHLALTAGLHSVSWALCRQKVCENFFNRF